MPILNTKTKAQLIEEIINFIRSRFRNIDMSPGQVARDLLVEAPAEFMYDNYVLVNFLNAAINLNNLESYILNEDLRVELANLLSVSISDVDNMITEVLVLHGENYGIIRKEATKASGTLSFTTTTRPTSATSIASGTICQIPESNLTFSTTAEITIPANPTAAYFNFDNNVWEFKVLASSGGGGSVYNVPPHTVTAVQPGQSVSFNVTNYNSFTGGTDVESNASLITRIKEALAGNFHGTASAILSTVLSYPFIDAAELAYLPTDPSKVREGLSQIDVFVKSDATNRTTDTESSYATNPIVLGNTYATSVYSVLISTNSYTISSVFYDLEIGDLGTSYVRFSDISESITATRSDSLGSGEEYISLSGGDTLQLINSGVEIDFPDPSAGNPISTDGRITVTLYDSDGTSTDDTANWSYTDSPSTIERSSAVASTTVRIAVGVTPATGDAVDIDYLYNQAIVDVVNYLNSDAVVFMGQDIQLFPAEQSSIYIDMRVQIETSYSSETKRSEITTAVTEFITGLGLGSSINKSDILDIVLDIAGVVDVDLGNMTLGIGTEDSPPEVSGDLTLDTDQYPIMGYLNLTLTNANIKN